MWSQRQTGWSYQNRKTIMNLSYDLPCCSNNHHRQFHLSNINDQQRNKWITGEYREILTKGSNFCKLTYLLSNSILRWLFANSSVHRKTWMLGYILEFIFNSYICKRLFYPVKLLTVICLIVGKLDSPDAMLHKITRNTLHSLMWLLDWDKIIFNLWTKPRTNRTLGNVSRTAACRPPNCSANTAALSFLEKYWLQQPKLK